MPEPIIDPDDGDTEVTTRSGKRAVLPPPDGTSSPLYNAYPDKDDDAPNTASFLERFSPGTKGLTDSLAGIERERGSAEQKQFGELSGRMAHDRAQMERAFSAESESANSIPPMWNADKEREAREHGPIEKFASIGSVFGLVASAFTKTPMISAMNASAAAMNAIKDHDEEAYKSAYDAWKENTSLALKRFGMERELFQDTDKLLTTDLEQWKIKQLAIAAQFDNKKAIAMLDAGMGDKVIEMRAAQVRAAEGIIKVQQEWAEFDNKQKLSAAQFDAWKKEHPPADPNNLTPKEVGQQLQAWHDILQGVNDPGGNIQLKLLRDLGLEHPDWSTEQKIEYLQQHQVGRPGGVGGAPTREKEIFNRVEKFKTDYQQRNGHPPSESEVDQAYDQASQDVANAHQPSMTPTGRLKTQGDVVHYDQAVDAIDASIKTLEIYQFSAGLAGRATRGAEIVGNIFGSNKTARSQLEANLEFLQTGARKLLFDQGGKPLAADSEQIHDQIGGLGFGATVANTLSRLRTIKKRYEELEQSDKDQLSGTWSPDKTSRKPAPSAGSPDKPTWQDEAVPIEPHVDIGAPAVQ